MIDGNHFALPALPLGQRFTLQITPRPAGSQHERDPELAPVRLPPFITRTEGIELLAQVGAWGALPVRVLASDGKPARGTHVTSVQDGKPHVSWQLPRVDQDGRIVLEQRLPGTHRVIVCRGITKLLEQDVMILPGRNPEVVMRLPATSGR